MEHTLKKNNIGNLILMSYLILTIIYYRFSFGILADKVIIGSINGLGILGLLLFWDRLKSKDLFIFITLMTVAGTVSFLITKNMDIINYLTFYRYFGISLVLLSIDINNKWAKFIMLSVIILLFQVFFYEVGYNMFVRTSQNYHSIILLLFNFVFNLSYWQKNKRVPLLPTFIAFSISFLSGGRGSILSYTIFLIGTVIYNCSYPKNDNEVLRWLFLKTGIVLIVVFLMANNYMIQNEMQLSAMPIESIVNERSSTPTTPETTNGDNQFESNLDQTESSHEFNDIEQKEERMVPKQSSEGTAMWFEKGFTSNARVNIIKRYYSGMIKNTSNLIFGYPLRESTYIARYNLNPHNSFLRLHANYGLLGSFLIAFLLIKTTYRLLTQKNVGLIIILFALLLRVLLDITAFPGNLDVPIYYILFQKGESLKKSIILK